MTPQPTLTPRSLLVAAAIFLVLAVIHTWPLATNPGGLSNNDNADTTLNEWAVSWVAHQIVRDPVDLFSGNIFHPNRYTLAYSEPLILPGLIGAPLRWFGASPVLTYNVLLLLGFVTTGFAMYFLMSTWTDDRLAALLAGSLLAFNAHTMTRLPHLQAIFMFALPLSLWAFDRLLAGGRTRHAVWLGLGVLGCALTSGYLVVFAVFALGAALLVRPDVWWRARRLGILGRLAAAGGGTLAVAVVVLWPYLELGGQEAFRRPLEGSIAAGPVSYLSTASRIHFSWWSHRIFRVVTEETLFPGVTVLGLSALALVIGHRTHSTYRRMLVAIAVVGFVMSLGITTPVYGWVHALFPPLHGIRAASRFGVLVLLSAAGLAGLGLAALRLRWPRRWMTVVSIGAIVVANLEALHAPIPFVSYQGIPAIYQPIAADPDPVGVLELPLFQGRSVHYNAPYMLASTFHWKPLVNGYSGFVPPGFRETVRLMMRFPADATVDALRDLHVRYVVVHTETFANRDRAARIERRAARHDAVALVAVDGGDRLYRIRDVR